MTTGINVLIEALEDIQASQRSYDCLVAEAALKKHRNEISSPAEPDRFDELCSKLDWWCATVGEKPWMWSMVASSGIYTASIKSFFSGRRTARERGEKYVSVAVSGKDRYDVLKACWTEAKQRLKKEIEDE